MLRANKVRPLEQNGAVLAALSHPHAADHGWWLGVRVGASMIKIIKIINNLQLLFIENRFLLLHFYEKVFICLIYNVFSIQKIILITKSQIYRPNPKLRNPSARISWHIHSYSQTADPLAIQPDDITTPNITYVPSCFDLAPPGILGRRGSWASTQSIDYVSFNSQWK